MTLRSQLLRAIMRHAREFPELHPYSWQNGIVPESIIGPRTVQNGVHFDRWAVNQEGVRVTHE